MMHGKLTIIGALGLCLLTAQGAGDTLAYYKGIYDGQYTTNQATYDSYAASGEGLSYYTFQYPLAATLSMYEATGDTNYLQRVLTWGQTMVSAATIIDDDGKKNWSGTWESPHSATPISFQLYDFQGSTELARVARIVLTNPALTNTFGSQATNIYNFVRDHIVNKHLYTRSGLAGFIAGVNQTNTCVNDKPVLLLTILVDLKVTSDALGGADNTAYNYPTVLSDMAKGLKDHNGVKPRFESFNGGLLWDKDLTFESPEYVGFGWDTQHANRVPCVVISLYREGIELDISYVQGIADLFTEVIWNQSLADPMFTNFIDGGNEVFHGRDAWNNGFIYSGWVLLSEFDEQTFTTTDAMLKAILAGVSNPSISYNDTHWGRISLAGHLAKAAAATDDPPTPPPISRLHLLCQSRRLSRFLH